ncbi:hypothetical protein [Halobacillus litoralis]|uniref:hypothetical protein n=1 Tax=Halobacillus litoralis TaxID=45668 RepID=UPI00359C2041
MMIIQKRKRDPIPKRRTSREYGSIFSRTALVETKEIPQNVMDSRAYKDALILAEAFIYLDPFYKSAAFFHYMHRKDRHVRHPDSPLFYQKKPRA